MTTFFGLDSLGVYACHCALLLLSSLNHIIMLCYIVTSFHCRVPVTLIQVWSHTSWCSIQH